MSVEYRYFRGLRTLALLQSTRDGEHSGVDFLSLRVEPGFPEILRVPLHQIDGSPPDRRRYEDRTVRYAEDGLSFEGTARENAKIDNAQLSSRPLRESYRVDGDRLVPR